MSLSKTDKIYTSLERAFPFLITILCVTIPFVKGIPGIVHTICVILFIVQIFIRREYQAWARYYYFIILLFLGTTAISLMYSSDIADGLRIYKGQCLLLLAVIMIERVCSPDSARRYLYAYAAGGTVLACIGVYQGFVMNIERPPNLYHPVWGANLLMISSIVLIALVLSKSSPAMKVLNGVMLAVHGVAIYLTGTRGVWIALLVLLFFIPFGLRNFGIKRKMVYYLILISLMTATTTQVGYFKERLVEASKDISRYDSKDSYTPLGMRFDMWKASWEIFKEHPILGVGAGDWKKEKDLLVNRHRAPETILGYGQTHNIYLDALSTRGVLGLVSLLLLLACPVYYALKRREPEYALFRNVVIFLAIAFSISGLTDTVVLLRLVFMSYVLVTGLGLAVLIRADRASTEDAVSGAA